MEWMLANFRWHLMWVSFEMKLKSNNVPYDESYNFMLSLLLLSVDFFSHIFAVCVDAMRVLFFLTEH